MKTVIKHLRSKILSAVVIGMVISGCGGSGNGEDGFKLSLAFSFPSDMNITKTNLITYIASTYDSTPYDPAIDIQGVIDMASTPNGMLVRVPYTVTGTSPVTLPAFSKTFTIASSSTQNNESGIVATFAWAEQANLPVGSGFFNAYITIDDTAGNGDNIYYAKKLDVDNASGLVAATFDYPIDDLGNKGTLTLKIMPGIPDRMFGKVDNNGDNTTHDFLYLPVTNPVTGRTWLNNNLGADYANLRSPDFNLTQQAKAANDFHAYGSLFQWGRKADGHELMQWIGSSYGIAVNGKTSTNADNPAHALFITETSSPNDWRVHQNDTLWADETSANNVCPEGYRLPLNPNVANDESNEFYVESQTWLSQDASGAFTSLLALTRPGYHRSLDASINAVNSSGYYWSGSANSTYSLAMGIYADSLQPTIGLNRAHGMSVRCIKDNGGT